MKIPPQFKTDWQKTKKKLAELSQDALTLAKKGEKEVVQLTHKSRLHFDLTKLNLKKEHLFYQIGREYVKTADKKTVNSNLKKFLVEFKRLEREHRLLKNKIDQAK